MFKQKDAQGLFALKAAIAPRGAGTTTVFTLPAGCLLFAVALHVEALFVSAGGGTLEVGGQSNAGAPDTDRYLVPMAVGVLAAGATFGLNGVALTTEGAVFGVIRTVTYTVAVAPFTAGVATLTALGYRFR